MKPIIIALFLVAGASFADDNPAPKLGERADTLLRQALPVCGVETKTTINGLQHKLPENLKGEVIRVESERQSCAGQWVAAVSREGGFFFGIPWFLDGLNGPIEAKLKQFGWKSMQQSFEPVVDRQRTRDGLLKVTMYQMTEHGKVPVEGEIDPEGTVFFIGHFYPLSSDYRESRLKIFQPFLDSSPAAGAAKPAVTVIEFSDFECPSCQKASGYMQPIMEKYGDQVRYIRFDFPLVSLHPWAFVAAVAGRAIYHQKPEAFWEYKKEVYANQEKLSAFTFDDFARGFVQGHDLDLKKYEAEISSPELQKGMLAGVGIAFANNILATPTYLVNGVNVDPGDGKGLEAYVAKLLKKEIKAPAKPGREKTSTSGQ